MYQFLRYLIPERESELPRLLGQQSIYTLDCPVTGHARYVGRTNNPKRRLTDHKGDYFDMEGHKDKRVWIACLREQGLSPRMTIVEKSVDPPEWAAVRELQWLLHYLQQGALLTNIEAAPATHPHLVRLLPTIQADLLNEPVGSLVWSTINEMIEADEIYSPYYRFRPIHDGVWQGFYNHLPPQEYGSISHARSRGRFSISAWTIPSEKADGAWLNYRYDRANESKPA